MKWLENKILRAAAALGALGMISTGFWQFWPSPSKAEFQVVQARSVDHEIRWLLQDKNLAVQAQLNAKNSHDKLYWKQKAEAIQIRINQLIKQDRRK